MNVKLIITCKLKLNILNELNYLRKLIRINLNVININLKLRLHKS